MSFVISGVFYDVADKVKVIEPGNYVTYDYDLRLDFSIELYLRT